MWARGDDMQLNVKDDKGFTLIELLVAIAILAVIAVPVGNLIIGVLRNSGPTADRLALSHDAQISTAYFQQDVAAMGARGDYSTTQAATGNVPYLQSVQVSAAYNQGGQNCGSTATEMGATALVRFFSDDWDATATPPTRTVDIVAYYLVPVGAVDELHRMKCLGASANPATPVSDVVVAHNVDPSKPVTVSCSSQCDSSTTPPQQVTVSFTVTKTSVGPYQITLSGQRRQT